MEMIARDKCVVSGTSDFERLHTFTDFPIFGGVTAEESDKDLKADMVWDINKSSGMVQLRELVPENILYEHGHNAGSTGGIWASHHKAFAKFIMRDNPSNVFEIGGGHGILSGECKKLNDRVHWTILEPAPPESASITGGGVKYVKGFFGENYKIENDFDAVVHSHVFEHIYEPDVFTRSISGCLTERRKMYFSVPNLFEWLKNKFTNALFFEHTFLLREEYIEYWLNKHNLSIERKEYFGGHSVFYACKKDANRTASRETDFALLYAQNKQLFLEYIEFYKRIARELNIKIKALRSPLYLFGAHIFSQYLIKFGLDTSKIAAIIDNDKNKHGKRLYGTNLTVYSPKTLGGVEHPCVILRAGIYNEEIKKDILENINSQTEFWM